MGRQHSDCLHCGTPPRSRQSKGGTAESAPVGVLTVRVRACEIFLTPFPERAVGTGRKCQIASPAKNFGLANRRGGSRGVNSACRAFFFFFSPEACVPCGDLLAARREGWSIPQWASPPAPRGGHLCLPEAWGSLPLQNVPCSANTLSSVATQRAGTRGLGPSRVPEDG